MDHGARQDPARLRWSTLYREAELYKAAVRLYTKPLFDWRKALVSSTDERTLYDFARTGLANLQRLHRELAAGRFHFRPGLALKRNFNGKRRTLYVFPWEERLVSLLLYRLLNRALDRSFSASSYAYRWRGFGVDRCQREIVRTLRAAAGPLYAIKRDIADFFDSIDHAVLLDKLARLVEPGDYLGELLTECVRFRSADEGEVRTAGRGVPFGTAVACLLANLYLGELDRRLEAIPGVRFFRYADDLLVVSTSRGAIGRAAEVFQDELAALRLKSKPTHEQDFLLTTGESTSVAFRSAKAAVSWTSAPREDAAFAERQATVESAPVLSETGSPGRSFPPRTRFRHLGLEFRADGSVGLGRDKLRKIRNLFRYAFRRHRRKFARIVDPEKRAMLAIRIARETVSGGVRNVAIIDYYLRHVSEESQLRGLDRWLAEEVLSLATGDGHKRGYFRRLPFARLRQMGLPSLVHRRRLVLHGKVDSPFFVWKTYQRRRGYGGPAARPRPSAASAFSQGPEAAAEQAS